MEEIDDLVDRYTVDTFVEAGGSLELVIDEMLVRRWFPTLPITLLGDTAYSILELVLECQEQQVSLITAFHLDADLHELPRTRRSYDRSSSRG